MFFLFDLNFELKRTLLAFSLLFIWFEFGSEESEDSSRVDPSI